MTKARARSPSSRLASTSPDSVDPLVLQAASRLKLIPYGKGSNDVRAAVEVASPRFREELVSVTLSRVGGLGLDLLEMDKLERSEFGIVLIGGIAAGSNAATPLSGSFALGDALVSVEAILAGGAVENKRPLEGLSFDATVSVLSTFTSYDTVRIVVKRLAERRVVTVKVAGPDGVPYTELKVLSGLGANLRTILQASNINMYAPSTARFDSPYETGNCGGDGTCGTCIVAITSGANLLNARVRSEDKALKIQAAAPNWRWACRTLVAEDEDAEGEVKLRLRPQTLL